MAGIVKLSEGCRPQYSARHIMTLSRVAERRYLQDGKHRWICGVDEAGRGPLCGPVVCAAALIEDCGELIPGIVDSKAVVKESDREAVYEMIIKDPRVTWGISVVSSSTIDELNILQATLLGMRQAVDQCMEKALSKKKIKTRDILVLVDGNRCPVDMPVDSQWVIKGDSFIYSIAAASILAKVTRDRIMNDLDGQYPAYGLSRHKGYPTYSHIQVLNKFGPVKQFYRFSYVPVKSASDRQQALTTTVTTTSPTTAVAKKHSQKPVVNKVAKMSAKIVVRKKTDSSSCLPFETRKSQRLLARVTCTVD